jgi:hypothetical protein
MPAPSSLTRDVLALRQHASLPLCLRQPAHFPGSERSPEGDDPGAGLVFTALLPPRSDFLVDPSESDHLARLQAEPAVSTQREELIPSPARHGAELDDQHRSGEARPFAAVPLMTGHWECQLCGARSSGPQPTVCASCGGASPDLAHPLEARLELASR